MSRPRPALSPEAERAMQRRFNDLLDTLADALEELTE